MSTPAPASSCRNGQGCGPALPGASGPDEAFSGQLTPTSARIPGSSIRQEHEPGNGTERAARLDRLAQAFDRRLADTRERGRGKAPELGVALDLEQPHERIDRVLAELGEGGRSIPPELRVPPIAECGDQRIEGWPANPCKRDREVPPLVVIRRRLERLYHGRDRVLTGGADPARCLALLVHVVRAQLPYPFLDLVLFDRHDHVGSLTDGGTGRRSRSLQPRSTSPYRPMLDNAQQSR